MDPVLQQWLRESITLEPFSEYDGRGKPTYQEGFVQSCFIVDKRVLLRDANGEEFVSRCVLVLPPDVTVTLQDRVTLPTGELLLVRQISQVYDEKGQVSHLEVYV